MKEILFLYSPLNTAPSRNKSNLTFPHYVGANSFLIGWTPFQKGIGSKDEVTQVDGNGDKSTECIKSP